MYQPSKRKYYQITYTQPSLTYYKVNMGQLEIHQKTQTQKTLFTFQNSFFDLESNSQTNFIHQILDFPTPSISENSSEKSLSQNFQEAICTQSKVRPTWDTWDDDDSFNGPEQYQQSQQDGQSDWEYKNQFINMNVQDQMEFQY